MENLMDRKFQEHADKLRAEGMTIGRAEGMTLGRAEGMTLGRAEGKIEMLLDVARKRFGVAPRSLEERLQAEAPEELDSWLDRLQEAPSIDAAMNGSGSWGNGASV